MLDYKWSKEFNVNLETFQSSAEEIKISEDIKFDIICVKFTPSCEY